MSEIADLFYQSSSKDSLIIAVTGTNGKTSITHLLAQAFTQLGKQGAVIGTLVNCICGGNYDHACKTTTPDPITVQATLKQFKDQGVKVVAMEASSHALHQHRLKAVNVSMGIFANLTRDHLDYHGSMENYADAKQLLFNMPSIRYGVFNLGDPVGLRWAKQFQKQFAVCGYTLEETQLNEIPFVVLARTVQFHAAGFRCDVITPWGNGVLNSSLIGYFNVQNLLAVLSALGLLGYSLKDILAVLATLKPIRGRMQLLGGGEGKPLVIIDFAHTPDALEKALNASRRHCRGKLICVFGCGGNRDVGKRPIMGGIAEKLADQVIVTDDNVRFEDPNQISQAILKGCSQPDKIHVEHDRKKAIQWAIRQAKPEDVILLAGKGHERDQIIGDQYLPFNEEQIVLEILNSKF